MVKKTSESKKKGVFSTSVDEASFRGLDGAMIDKENWVVGMFHKTFNGDY